MLAATLQLIAHHGNDDFTLKGVALAGKVSVGSIYLRYPSKDRLIRTVLSLELDRIAAEDEKMVRSVLNKADDLAEAVALYIEGYGHLLATNALILRTAMNRAEHDPELSVIGKAQAEQSAVAAMQIFLALPQDIGGSRKQAKADVAFRLIFAALAWEFGLGTTRDSARWIDWAAFRTELALACLAYLQHAPCEFA
ncbi:MULTISPECIES: TetR/AcrR family transcriptional regulator [unclassified Novosphingobium]|uniref:TetR/AcrR family transcriptional regulator n=1 Tax=unclassified Novosphingobium TaxID=2644732 RepID=UPI0014481E57|nr:MULTISPECIES: TetR/AcrR family transcriptional regulator [unclassified Novosphingobium]NKJ45086.1 AcrR family transcriptional regulator [Novosphingobium sp. SG720]NMN06438.1 AcrR family transcriptional regulator [Novosphingobium sp. SG919]NMN89115.1 AcrR family transcriptional regulator [Novosphingobium sp. SG916]